jgi:hypothetical protein
MKNGLLLLFLAALLFGCKAKKANLSGEALVKPSDFIAAFKPLSTPFTIADSNINKIADTILIAKTVFTQFVPDSVLSQIIPSEKKATIKPIGSISKQNSKELYLLAAITQNKKTTINVFVFDKKNKFLAYKTLLSSIRDDDGYFHSVSISGEPTFLISKEKLNPQTKLLQFTRIGWVYSNTGVFMVIVNDSNEDTKRNNEIINPIDTLPRKNKLSGDYAIDKKNFISIRDGKNANNYRFFIHIEKKDANCVGELKGDLKMNGASKGKYNQAGDACELNFSFEDREVTIKEGGSCGNRRGMDCTFNDTFIKKKESKPSKKKK